MLRSFSATAIALTLCAGTLNGQDRAEERSILRAALLHVFESARASGHPITGGVKLDPRAMPVRWTPGPDPKPLGPIFGPNRGADRSPDLLGAITRGLPVGLEKAEDAIRCPDGPPSCRMLGAQRMVSMSDPIVMNGTARILVQTKRANADPDIPIIGGAYMLTLTRTQGTWTVSDKTIIGGT